MALGRGRSGLSRPIPGVTLAKPGPVLVVGSENGSSRDCAGVTRWPFDKS